MGPKQRGGARFADTTVSDKRARLREQQKLIKEKAAKKAEEEKARRAEEEKERLKEKKREAIEKKRKAKQAALEAGRERKEREEADKDLVEEEQETRLMRVQRALPMAIACVLMVLDWVFFISVMVEPCLGIKVFPANRHRGAIHETPFVSYMVWFGVLEVCTAGVYIGPDRTEYANSFQCFLWDFHKLKQQESGRASVGLLVLVQLTALVSFSLSVVYAFSIAADVVMSMAGLNFRLFNRKWIPLGLGFVSVGSKVTLWALALVFVVTTAGDFQLLNSDMLERVKAREDQVSGGGGDSALWRFLGSILCNVFSALCFIQNWSKRLFLNWEVETKPSPLSDDERDQSQAGRRTGGGESREYDDEFNIDSDMLYGKMKLK